MNASIKDLIAANPSGLLELKSPLSFSEYRENFGFGLKSVFTIYKSKEISCDYEEWFAFSGKKLDTLFEVCEECKGDLIVVFIVETIKDGKIYCNLILSDDAYRKILDDKSCRVLQVHQMFLKFFQDHLVLNVNMPKVS